MTMMLVHGKMIRPDTLAESLLTPALRDKINALKAEQDAILVSMSTDTERLAAFNSLTAAFELADQTLEGALTTLVSAASTRVGNEETRAAAAEAALQTAIDGLRTQVAAIAPAYTAAISVESGRAQAAEAALQAAVDGLETSVATFQTDLTALTTRVAAVETAASDAASAATAAQASADAAQSVADDNATAIGGHGVRIDALEAITQGYVSVANIRNAVPLTGVIDGTNKVFRVPDAYVAGTLVLLRNGVTYYAESYAIDGADPQQLTLSFSPDAGMDDVRANYIKS